MTTPQAPTIGSDACCDLVVKSYAVSGQHCRLTNDGNSLTLTDLDSTNGTFINGQRLRGSDNTVVLSTVVLSDVNVSMHHARLIVDGNEIVCEDLGSTNGTSNADSSVNRVRLNDTRIIRKQ